ncbi:ATP-binding protein [Streptosporangium nondiastaticum]|uniref:ATP-binding protein n=1 Tax=Streptosporangium nondiastaticum TaxID=35764 RepID=A0A9X7JPT4_9ACTN|nr:ATP-binding protein [Streptosporangium nondiastaticum]PSJ27493.1 ATP-binding protein [Streptosporangium nondiastaticum]
MSTTRPCPPPGDPGPGADGAASSGTSGASGAPGAPGDAGAPSGTPSPEAPSSYASPGGVRRLHLVGVSGAVPMSRDFTRQALYDWGWLPATGADHRAAAEDVLLVVSELVTNACLHADGPEELRVSCAGKVLRLEVVDLGAGTPAPRTPHRAGRPGGHGMFIVQRLCLDWGVVRNESGAGKTVWAELAAPG